MPATVLQLVIMLPIEIVKCSLTLGKKDAPEKVIGYTLTEYTGVCLAFCVNGIDSLKVTNAHLSREGHWKIRLRNRRDIFICHKVPGGK